MESVESTAQQRALVRLLQSGIALLALLIIGTIGYHALEQMTLVDALYMTVITISTVGFGEVQQLESDGRLFTIFLIVCGGGVGAYSISIAAEFFLSGEWQTHLKQRRRLRMLQQLTNHTIVCGYGRIGRHVADELRVEGIPFVVMEMDAEKVESVRQAGFLALHGDASNEADLYAAGIERASSLVAAASSDAENVFIVLTARSMRPDLVIIARANADVSEEKMRRAGASRVILPYRIAGRRMVTLVVRPDVADFLDEVMHTNEIELLVEQVQLAADSVLVGQTFSGANLRSQFGVTVLACRLPGEPLNTQPTARTVLRAHSLLIVLGTRDQLQHLQALARGEVGLNQTIPTDK